MKGRYDSRVQVHVTADLAGLDQLVFKRNSSFGAVDLGFWIAALKTEMSAVSGLQGSSRIGQRLSETHRVAGLETRNIGIGNIAGNG